MASLRSKRFRASGTRAKKEMKGEGEGIEGTACSVSSPPFLLPLPFSFCSRSNFRAIRLETLATQASIWLKTDNHFTNESADHDNIKVHLL